MQRTEIYQNFLNNLYEESPRAAYAFEAVKYGLMARTGLSEGDALEVTCKCLVAAGPRDRIQPYPINSKGVKRNVSIHP